MRKARNWEETFSEEGRGLNPLPFPLNVIAGGTLPGRVAQMADNPASMLMSSPAIPISGKRKEDAIKFLLSLGTSAAAAPESKTADLATVPGYLKKLRAPAKAAAKNIPSSASRLNQVISSRTPYLNERMAARSRAYETIFNKHREDLELVNKFLNKTATEAELDRLFKLKTASGVGVPR